MFYNSTTSGILKYRLLWSSNYFTEKGNTLYYCNVFISPVIWLHDLWSRAIVWYYKMWYIHTPSPPGLVSHWKFWWGAGLRDQNLCDTQGGGRFNSTNPQRRNTDIFSIDTLYALVVGHGPDPHLHNHLESFSISTYNLPVSSLNNLSGSFLLDTVQHGHQTWVGRGDFEIQKTGSNKTHMMMKIMTPH